MTVQFWVTQTVVHSSKASSEHMHSAVAQLELVAEKAATMQFNYSFVCSVVSE